MANNQPVTEGRLIAILKGFRKETQLDLDKLRKELRADFQEALAQYHEDEIIPRLDDIKKEVHTLNKRVEKIDQDLKWVRQDLKDIKAEFSTFASIKQFAELKSKILSLQEELDEVKQRIGLANNI